MKLVLRYDFDRNDRDKIYNVSPRDLWETQYGGYARAFFISGSKTYNVSWNLGERVGEGAIIK